MGWRTLGAVGLGPLAITLTISWLLAGCDCAGEARTRDGGPPIDAQSADDAGPDPVDAPRDAPRPDAPPTLEDGEVSGLVCEACTVDGDCSSGYPCVELPTGAHVCLRPCDRDLPDCPARFDCVESLIAPLPEPVCAPIGERCCVDADGDDHGVGVGCRGLDCDETDDEVHSDGVEACDGEDDDCDGTIDEGNPGAGLVCSTGMTGACATGVTICEMGTIVCRPDAGSMTETCDGRDEDCDSAVDEDDMGRALSRSCYDGPAGTDGVGGCTAGVQTCAGGEYRSCLGQVLPGTEDCDGVDDDCDGTIDDGDPGGGIACTAPEPGICAAGRTACTAGSIRCVSTIAPGSQPEICDTLDNDCDGMTNEGFTGLGTSCFAGTGACRRAGVRICDASDPTAMPVCDAMPGTPSPTDTCDYEDDDCDGTTDEGHLLGRVCTAGVGACQRSGVTECTASGSGTQCNAMAGTATTETCNYVDDDCDGTVDDGFSFSGDPLNPGMSYALGSACAIGLGACRRGGVVVCGGGSATCSAPVVAGMAESCNYVDDDCDGTVDDGFVDSMGRYANDMHCGACGIDCTAIFAFPGSFGTCTTASGSARCQLNCTAGRFNLNGIPDDGCEFALDAGGIYVSGEDMTAIDDATCGFGPTGTGGSNHPCRTIGFGITRAMGSGRARVLVADALYTESVTLVNGISLLGGYRADTWERHLTTTLTTVRAPTGAGHRRTITATGITAVTLVEGFSIEGASATTAGANSYAVYVNGGTNALTFRSNVIRAGNGAPGAAGSAGTDGASGTNGTAGVNAIDTGSVSCATTRSASAGGALSCGATSVSGGAGGGAACPTFWDDVAPYTTGSSRAGGGGAGPAPGAGGAIAFDGQTRSAEMCLLCYLPPGGGTMTGGNGAPGGDGSDGAGGAGAASAVGSIAASEWVGASGVGGGIATHGGGGGGGASGGGGDGTGGIWNCTDDLGATGGGGGSGACGGTAGGGGTPGGGSFGIFLVNPGATRPVLSMNTIYRGFGGSGGNGGRGGAGGIGGAGANGGLKSTANPSFCTGDGGVGGDGGDGGQGGGGGGAAGGVSYGIYAQGVVGYGAGTNTFPASGGGGAGGGGGPSIGTSGTPGAAGAAAATN